MSSENLHRHTVRDASLVGEMTAIGGGKVQGLFQKSHALYEIIIIIIFMRTESTTTYKTAGQTGKQTNKHRYGYKKVQCQKKSAPIKTCATNRVRRKEIIYFIET